MTWKNVALKWAAVTLHDAQCGDITLDEFQIDLDPTVHGRLDVFAIRKDNAWEYFPVVSNSAYWESVEPGVEAWNQVLLLQVQLYRAPLAGEDDTERHAQNAIVYKHPDIQLDTTFLNPNDYTQENVNV